MATALPVIGQPSTCYNLHRIPYFLAVLSLMMMTTCALLLLELDGDPFLGRLTIVALSVIDGTHLNLHLLEVFDELVLTLVQYVAHLVPNLLL